MNRAILETPTSRGDDAPCSAQMRPPLGSSARTLFAGSRYSQRDGFHVAAATVSAATSATTAGGARTASPDFIGMECKARRTLHGACSCWHRPGIIRDQTNSGGWTNTYNRARCHPMLHTQETTLRFCGTCSVLPGRQSAQPICASASSSCQRLHCVQTTGKIGPILDHHSVELLHNQPLEPLAMSSPPASGLVGLFRPTITASASEIAGLGSAAQLSGLCS